MKSRKDSAESVMLHVRVTKEQKEAIARLADRRGKTPSELVRDLVLLELGKSLFAPASA